MAESSSPSIPALPGLAVETVEWLPSGAESGLVRVRGRWTDEAARQPDLPVLALRAAGAEHRFDSLPDARFSRDPASWRGTYLVPAALVASDPDALWLEWAGGTRAGLPALSRGVEPPPVPGTARPEPRSRGLRRRGDRPGRARRAARPPGRGVREAAGAGRRRGAEGRRGAGAALDRAGAAPGGGDRRARRARGPRDRGGRAAGRADGCAGVGRRAAIALARVAAAVADQRGHARGGRRAPGRAGGREGHHRAGPARRAGRGGGRGGGRPCGVG